MTLKLQSDIINENFAYLNDKVREVELFKFPNATIIGEPTIQNGQVSDFSTVSYLQFPFILDLHEKAFQIDMCFTTATNVQTQQNILDSKFGIALAIQNGKGVMAISSNGTSWDVGSVTGTQTLQANTTYYARLIWNRLQYKTQLSTDGVNYVDDMVIVNTARPHPTTIFIGGCDTVETGHAGHPFLGTINMNKCTLSVMGNVIWQGMDDAGLSTRADVSLSNLDELGQAKFDAKQDISSLSQTLDNSTTKYPSNAAVKAAIDAKDSLPDQTGNDGKFLTTDGTTASWAEIGGGFYNRVHDCILENPRYIIWEQDGNTLTLKAGTKLWYPDGRSVVLENDISGTMTSASDFVWVDLENNSLLFKMAVMYGPEICDTISDWPSYYNDGWMGYIISENKYMMSQNHLPVGDYPIPLPVTYKYNSTTRTYSLIIDESTFNKGMIVFHTELDKAEHIFIPEGIKTLACSGLKTDGSYNNVEYTTPSVMALDRTSAYFQPHYFAIKTDGTVQISDSGFKVTDDNYLQNLSTNEVFSGVRLGNHRGKDATNIYDTLDLQNSTRVFYWDD